MRTNANCFRREATISSGQHSMYHAFVRRHWGGQSSISGLCLGQRRHPPPITPEQVDIDQKNLVGTDPPVRTSTVSVTRLPNADPPSWSNEQAAHQQSPLYLQQVSVARRPKRSVNRSNPPSRVPPNSARTLSLTHSGRRRSTTTHSSSLSMVGSPSERELAETGVATPVAPSGLSFTAAAFAETALVRESAPVTYLRILE